MEKSPYDNGENEKIIPSKLSQPFILKDQSLMAS